MADRVIFRTWRARPKTCIAFLPDTPASPGHVMAYEHVGQHGEADYIGLLPITRPATPDECTELLAELRDIGYNPVVRQRMQKT